MSQIRSCFTSRFKYGQLFEVDFSQLEVAVLAFLTQDHNLIADIEEAKDMHLVSASWVSGEPYEDLLAKYLAGDLATAKLRKAAKRPRFELQYGAGARTIAKNNGWPVSMAHDYIDRYYARYPKVKTWQEDVAQQVKANMRPKKKFSGVDPEYISYYTCPHTHRRYVFESKIDRKGSIYFSPTQMKNYPVQGFATGDLVPAVVGRIPDVLASYQATDSIIPINTVHDSVLFDVDEASIIEIHEVIAETFGRAHEIMEEDFGININVPIRYNVSTGPDWGNMKEMTS